MPDDGKNAKNKRWREKNRALGLCERCGKPREPGRVLCAYHLEKRKADANRRYAKKIAANVCPVCRTQSPEVGTICSSCKPRVNCMQRVYYERRKNGGNVAPVQPAPAEKSVEVLPVTVEAMDPRTPTNAKPGTAEKIEVLCARCDIEIDLFVAGDAEYDATALIDKIIAVNAGKGKLGLRKRGSFTYRKQA